MGMTVLDFHPLTDRLAQLIVENKWREAEQQCELMRRLLKAISKHMSRMAEEHPNE